MGRIQVSLDVAVQREKKAAISCMRDIDDRDYDKTKNKDSEMKSASESECIIQHKRSKWKKS